MKHEILYKICDLECTLNELKDFNRHIDTYDFDFTDSFDDFYHLDTILNALSQFDSNKIDTDYLSYWANAYNWIIMSTKWRQSDKNETKNFKQFVKNAISDLLDSLSFADLSQSTIKTSKFRAKFVALDNLLEKVTNDYVIYFVPCNKDDPMFVNFLCINNVTKESIEVDNGYLSYGDNRLSEKQITKTKFKELISLCHKNNYKKTKLVIENLENSL